MNTSWVIPLLLLAVVATWVFERITTAPVIEDQT